MHRSAHSAGLAPILVKTPLDASSRQEMHICSLMIDEYDEVLFMKLLAVPLFCKLKRDAQSEPSYQSVLDLRTVGHILKGKGGLLESCESEILRQGDPQMAEVLFLQTGGVLLTRHHLVGQGWSICEEKS